MSFRLKIILGLLGIQILLMLILVWSSLNFLRISNEIELSNRAASAASIMASTLGAAVAHDDIQSVTERISDVLAQPGIVYIRVLDNNGVLSEVGDPAPLARPFREDFLFEDVTDDIYDAAAELFDHGMLIGRVEVGISTLEVRDIMAAARREMATIAVFGLALSLLFSLVLGNYFARQLKRLKDATRRIASGDIGYQLAVAGHDELAQTANAFNTMSRKLAMLYSEKQSALNRARQQADELQDRERHIHAVLDHAMDAIFTFDENGILESFNPAAMKIFGYGADECLGQAIDLIIPEPWRAELLRLMRDFLRTGDAGIFGATREIEGRRKNGALFPLEIAISEVQIEGRYLFIAIARDITQRRLAEAELRKAQEAALESSRHKFEFIANVSQEIRAPVNEMISAVNVLTETALSADQRARAEQVKASGDSLVTIINDMLDFSRIEAGKLELESIDFDLRRTVDAVCQMFRDQAGRKGIDLVYVVPATAPRTLRGDPTRLRQLLINLIDNALKFTERGEVVLRIDVAEVAGSAVVLRFVVEDTGIGMAPATRQRIFELFSHIDAERPSSFNRSSGLGLMISRRLAEMMQGTIGVDSEIGKGSRFWFTARFELPAVASPAASGAHMDLSSLKVLIVNPDTDACEVRRASINASGLRSHCIEEGASALSELGAAAARGQPYDVVIFDRVSSGMSGLQFARALHGDRRLAGTRMIMIAATGYRGDGEEVRQAGIQAYLTAPVDSGQLINCLHAVARLGAGDRDGFITRHNLPMERQLPRRQALVVSADAERQKQMLGRLQRQGLRASLAQSQGEALEASAYDGYDLVVIDNELRELLTAEGIGLLRQRLPAGGGHVPVVVIVAPGVSDDRRAAYRSAGADECCAGIDAVDSLTRDVVRHGAG